MFKLYRAQRDAQLRWIRNHPVQYVALNAALLVVWIGYIEYQDRRALRSMYDTETTDAN